MDVLILLTLYLTALKLYKNRLDGLNTTGYGESKMNNLITLLVS